MFLLYVAEKQFYQLLKSLNFSAKNQRQKPFTNQKSGKPKCEHSSNQPKSRVSAESSQSRWKSRFRHITIFFPDVCKKMEVHRAGQLKLAENELTDLDALKKHRFKRKVISGGN